LLLLLYTSPPPSPTHHDIDIYLLFPAVVMALAPSVHKVPLTVLDV